MNREQVIQQLRAHRDELRRQYGVQTLAVFGSTARNTAAGTSDVDILVEFESRPTGLFAIARLRQRLEEILGGASVDLIPRSCVHPALRDQIDAEAIHAA